MEIKWISEESIYSGINFKIFRINNEIDNKKYILKKSVNNSEYLNRKLRNEYKLLQEIDSPNVVKAISWETIENAPVLILEDLGNLTLKKFLEERKLNANDFLDFAIQITSGLNDIHKRNIIHKDINPSNIMIHKGFLKIIDFNISEKILEGKVNFANSLEGTLEYVSPEQTGKLQTNIDLRSDLYSLGITFYEMLAGFVPFSNENIDEILSDHISKIALSLKKINKKIPETLSEIVMKLIRKDPDERYQSSIGLSYDLKKVQIIIKQGTNENFELGKKDVISRVKEEFIDFVSEESIREIEKGIETVLSGKMLFTFSQSYFVNRNSQLVNKIIEKTNERKFMTISINCQNTVEHSNKYLLRNVIKQIYNFIKFKTENVEKWSKLLNLKLGDNCRIISDLYPKFAEIVGERPELPELTIMEDKKRFFLTIRKFLSLFPKKNLALILIIKNIQLADNDLFELVSETIFKIQNNYTWVFCEYQKDFKKKINELIDNLDKNKVIVKSIKPSKNDISHINNVLKTRFWFDEEKLSEIAKIMYYKTNGDSFFLNFLLKKIIDEKIIRFDFEDENWVCDIERLNFLHLSQNVVDSILENIEELDEKSRKILFVASCVGSFFSWGLINKLCKYREKEIKEGLRDLIRKGFINFIKFVDNEEHYEFPHEKIFKKSYELYGEEEKDEINKALFEYYLKKYNQDLSEDNILKVVEYLNEIKNIKKIEDYLSKKFKYNLLAGEIERSNANYHKALFFYKNAMGIILDENYSKINIKENINVVIETAELSYTNNEEEYLNKLIDIGIKNSNSNIEKASLLEFKMRSEFSHNLLRKSLQTGIECSNLLDFKLGNNPSKITVLLEFLRTKIFWLKLNKKQLKNIPESRDENLIKLVNILLLMSVTSYITKPNLLAVIVFKMMRLLTGGCPKEGIHFFAGYGMILCGIFNDIENGYEMGDLAINLIKKYKAEKESGRTVFTVYAFVYPWKKHMVASLNPLLDSMENMIRKDDFEYYSSALLTHSYLSYFVGKNLKDLINKEIDFNKILKDHNQIQFYIRNSMWIQFFIKFSEEKGDDSLLNGDFFNETIMMPKIRENKITTSIFDYCLMKMILGVYFYHYEDGYTYSLEASQTLKARTGSILTAIYYFYDSLLLLNITHLDKTIVFERLNKNQKKLKYWAKLNPENFKNKYLLVEAEKNRKLKKYLEAEEFFEESIKLARENSFIHEEALAKELLAKLYIEKNISKLALLLLQEALDNYQDWGAENKIKHINKLYRELFVLVNSSTTIITNSSFQNNKNLKVNDPILQTYQTITGEINLENLLKKLMNIVLRNSGADRGIILIKIKEDIFVSAESSINDDKIKIFQDLKLKEYKGLSHDILEQTIALEKYVLIDNLINNEVYYEDSYFTNSSIKSLLCLPIQNNEGVQGYLYLENKFVKGAFTRNKLRLIEIIASQLASALNTALLYKNIEQSEEKYRILVDNLKDGVFIIQDDKLQYVNKALLNMLEIERENVIGELFLNFVAPEYKDLVMQNYNKRLNNQEVVREYEISIVSSSGEKIPVILSSGIISYNDKFAIEGTVKDIRERKMIEKVQKEYNKNLKYQISKKTQAIRYLLDNAGEGFLSIDENLLIGEEFSRECFNIFDGENIAKRDFVELFFPGLNRDNKNITRDIFDKIFKADDELKLDVYSSLLPSETKVKDKYLKLKYNFINKNKIMIIAKDITDSCNLELKMKIEQNNLRMVVKAISDANFMKRSINDYKRYFTIDILEELNSNLDYWKKINIIFRKVHTYKGDLSQWDMSYVTAKLSQVENFLSQMISNKTVLEISELREKLFSYDFLDWINHEIKIISDRIGKNIFNEEDKVLVDKKILYEIENDIMNGFPYDEIKTILPKIRRLRYVNFKSLISPFRHYIEKIAERLGKLVNPLEVTGEDIFVDYDIYYDFSKTIVHLFRNMVDHGIELPEERLKLGKKSEVGNIKCHLSLSESKKIIMELSDDGAGIDLNSIKKKLIKKDNDAEKINSLSEKELLQNIFNDGFTTKDKVSEISGRGVGLSALKSEIEKLNGEISVLTKLSEGTTFRISLPIIEKNVMKKIEIGLIINSIERQLFKYFQEELALTIEKENSQQIEEYNVKLLDISAFIDLCGMSKTRIIISFSKEKAYKLLNLVYGDEIDEENKKEFAKANIAEILNIIVGNSLRQLEENKIFLNIGTPTILTCKDAVISEAGQSAVLNRYKSKYGELQLLYRTMGNNY